MSAQKLLLNHCVEHSWRWSSDPCVLLRKSQLAYLDPSIYQDAHAKIENLGPRAPFVAFANPGLVPWNRKGNNRQMNLHAKSVTSRQCSWVAIEKSHSSERDSSWHNSWDTIRLFSRFFPHDRGSKIGYGKSRIVSPVIFLHS
jgi:hypothetical protein